MRNSDVSELFHQGIAKSRLGRHEDAISSYELVLAVQPSHLNAINNRGVSLMTLGRNEEALNDFRRVLEENPRSFEALTNCGNLLVKLQRYQKAIAIFDKVLEMDPDCIDALNHRGIALIGLRRYTEALASFDKVLEMDPSLLDALNNRGYALEKMMRPVDALLSYDRALDIKPDFVEALDNRSIALAKLHRFDEALESVDAAQKVRPDFVKAHLHEGLTRLRMGDFRLGLRKYEWRWLDLAHDTALRKFAQPLWLGKSDLNGKTILLHAEQGIGDLIQFSRYVPLVAARGGSVLLEMPGLLTPLMSSLSGVSRMLTWGESLPVTDFHCPLLSLPLAFGTTMDTIPASVPYLSVDPAAAAAWRGKLAPKGETLVGICWRGNPDYKDDRERSIRFADFSPLLSVPGIRFVSLQKELMEDERQLAATLPMVHPGSDFKSTAEMIAALDLVISVDTAWAHWAGAIGRPLWMLLPFSPHWVWFTDREDSPWYPTARLFRQSSLGDWSRVVGDALAALSQDINRFRPSGGSANAQMGASIGLVNEDLRLGELADLRKQGADLVRLRRHEDALSVIDRALAIAPDQFDLLSNRGGILIEQGRHEQALASIEKALEIHPGSVEALSNQSIALQALNRGDAALASLTLALKLKPDSFEVLRNRATLLCELMRYEAALDDFDRAIGRRPDDAELRIRRGDVLAGVGRYAEALSDYEHALPFRRDSSHLLNRLGNALQMLGRGREAEGKYRRALELNPDFHEAHSNLGNTLRDLGRLSEAEESCRRALDLADNFAYAHNNLGTVLKDLGRLTEAVSCFRRAIDLDCGFAKAYGNLGNVLLELGDASDAEKSYRQAIELKPEDQTTQSNLLFVMANREHYSSEEYLLQAKSWEKFVVPPQVRTDAKSRSFARARRDGTRLRIGYVSGDFRKHAVSYFLEQVLECHDRRRVELFAYPTVGLVDRVSDRIRQRVDHWQVIAGLSDASAADLIARQEIDVLIDLSGHTANNRLGVFARRAAPIQCHYIGYFASTGLTEMDYFIGDSVLIPESHGFQYSETVWRLPRVWMSYAAPDEAPTPVWEKRAGRRICLGSFNHLRKVNESTVALWARVLRRIPNSLVLLKTRELDDDENRRRILAAFKFHGIPASRIELLGRTEDWTEHMSLYARLDIALDPIGGSTGATTTCDALWMGVPVVTMIGNRYSERMTASMLTAIGRDDWIATDAQDYVEKVARLSSDTATRRRLRFALRSTMRASQLVDAEGLARDLERAFDAMFEQWSLRASGA